MPEKYWARQKTVIDAKHDTRDAVSQAEIQLFDVLIIKHVKQQ